MEYLQNVHIFKFYFYNNYNNNYNIIYIILWNK